MFTTQELQSIYYNERNPNYNHKESDLCDELNELEKYYKEYMKDLNIRKGKGWIKTKKL